MGGEQGMMQITRGECAVGHVSQSLNYPLDKCGNLSDGMHVTLLDAAY